MRGGERLVKECSWMRGICSRLYHSTEKYKTFSCRCPSSVMVNNRFRSADYLPCQLFNFGMIATGNHNFERFAALCNTPEVEPRRLRRSGSPGWRPLQAQKLSVYERVVTGWVREPTYRCKLRAALSGGIAARVAKLATPTELKKFLAYSNQRTTPPQSDLSVPKCRQICQLQLCIKHLYAINGYSC